MVTIHLAPSTHVLWASCQTYPNHMHLSGCSQCWDSFSLMEAQLFPSLFPLSSSPHPTCQPWCPWAWKGNWKGHPSSVWGEGNPGRDPRKPVAAKAAVTVMGVCAMVAVAAGAARSPPSCPHSTTGNGVHLQPASASAWAAAQPRSTCSCPTLEQ